MSDQKWWLGTLTVLSIMSGCSGPIVAVRKQAAQDMECDGSKIEIVRAAGGNSTESGPYYARGCDKQWRYVVGCNVAGYCIQPQGTDVKGILDRQAAFDLDCTPDAIKSSELNGDTFGAAGCGRHASYVLICGTGGCKAVQNTQTQ